MDAANCVKSLFVDDSGKPGILHIPERQLVHGGIQDQDQVLDDVFFNVM